MALFNLKNKSMHRFGRSGSQHRRQRVILGRLISFIWDEFVNLLYITGFTIEREEKHLWRNIRHLFRYIFSVIARVFSYAWKFGTESLKNVYRDITGPFVKLWSTARSHRDVINELKDAPAEVKRARNREFYRNGIRWNIQIVNRFMNYLLPALCLILCIFSIKRLTGLNYVIKVTQDGEDIGYVEDQTVYENAVYVINSRLVNVSSNTWTPDTTLTISVAEESSISDQNDMADKLLLASGTDITEATGLYIGGQFYGATTEGTSLQAAIDSIIEPYEEYASTLGDDVSVRFARTVELVDGIFPSESVMEYSEIYDLITATDKGNVYYDAVDGENIAEIAVANGLSVFGLQELNPSVDLSGEVLVGNAKLLVAEGQSLISVKTIRTVKTVTPIAYTTKTNLDSRFNLGYYSVTSEGEDGEETVITEIEYQNGEEVSSTVISDEITKEPVDRVIVIGTSGAGETVVGGGVLLWPTGPYQFVSRGFIPGYHRGYDIAATMGTAIYAADSGTVIVSTDLTYDYGRYVIIDHGNGMNTVYAHMTQRLTEVGATANAGDLIGLVGSTGNSTGPHLHFEVRINGERIDPEPYITGSSSS